MKFTIFTFFAAICLFLSTGASGQTPCEVDGGTLTTQSPTSFCKSDGADDFFELNVEGAEGEFSAFVVTYANGQIFMISESNTFNLEGIPGNGICLFWHISWNGELSGVVIGGNAGNIMGCYDLSNPITVVEWFSNGGDISTDDETTFCVGDGIDDIVTVTLTGTNGANGQNTAWVVTDSDLNILNITESNVFNFEGAEPGDCIIWHLGWVGTLNGAEIGANAADLTGDCFDLSNPITVTREDCEPVCDADGGTISTMSPTTTFCKSDGESNVFVIDLEGAVGENGVYVVTFLDGEIILISESNTFDLEGIPGNGTCQFWHLSWTGELTGAVVGGNAADLMGECFDLSNPIEVVEQFANGGEISTTATGAICTGSSIPVSISNAGGANGQNVVWVVTSEDLTILNITATVPNFMMPGTYLLWRLGYVGALNGADIGSNAADLTGDCFDLSNPLTVVVADCAGPGFPIYEYNVEISSSPNPTSGSSMVFLTANFGGRSTLEVYDMTGKNIALLLNQEIQSGQEYRMEFNASGLPNGVYIYRLTTENGVYVHKFMVAK